MFKSYVQLKILLITSLLISGCYSVRTVETTRYETIKQTDTLYTETYIQPEEAFIDSLKQWTLENLCKGDVQIDTNGLKLRIIYHWKKAMRDSLSNRDKFIQELQYQLQKAQEVKVVTETKKREENLFLRIISNFDLVLFIAFVTTLVILFACFFLKR